jgi:hypothetical protein
MPRRLPPIGGATIDAENQSHIRLIASCSETAVMLVR